jgi:hypothetical protein
MRKIEKKFIKSVKIQNGCFIFNVNNFKFNDSWHINELSFEIYCWFAKKYNRGIETIDPVVWREIVVCGREINLDWMLADDEEWNDVSNFYRLKDVIRLLKDICGSDRAITYIGYDPLSCVLHIG